MSKTKFDGMDKNKKPYGKWIAKLSRIKFRLGRGQSYISIINTMLLLGIAIHINNLFLIIGIGIGTLLVVFLIGMIDDRLKITHAESDHNIEATTPYFANLKNDITRIKEILEKQEKARG